MKYLIHLPWINLTTLLICMGCCGSTPSAQNNRPVTIYDQCARTEFFLKCLEKNPQTYHCKTLADEFSKRDDNFRSSCRYSEPVVEYVEQK